MDDSHVRGIDVRSFAPADAEVVAALIGNTIRYSNSRDYPRAMLDSLIAYFTPDKLLQLAAERQCLVAEVDGRVVATAALDGTRLATFFVNPDHQGRGIGTVLLRALEEAALKAGLPAVYVDASITGVPFYEARGYERTGSSTTGTAGPQVELVKAIERPVIDEQPRMLISEEKRRELDRRIADAKVNPKDGIPWQAVEAAALGRFAQ